MAPRPLLAHLPIQPSTKGVPIMGATPDPSDLRAEKRRAYADIVECLNVGQPARDQATRPKCSPLPGQEFASWAEVNEAIRSLDLGTQEEGRSS